MAVPQGADQDGDSSDLAPLIDAPADANNDAPLAGGSDGDGNGDGSALLHVPTAPQGAPEGSAVAVADGQQMEATGADSNKLPGSFVFMVVSAQFMAFGYGTPFVHLVRHQTRVVHPQQQHIHLQSLTRVKAVVGAAGQVC